MADHDIILDILDRVVDEGDRVYLGSTNDVDRLRSLAPSSMRGAGDAIVEKLKKWSDDCEDAKSWGGPTMYPPFPLTRAEILALANVCDLTPRAAASVTTASGKEEVAAKVEGEGSRETLKTPSPPRPVAGEGEARQALEKIKAYLVSEDLMKCWDAARALIIEGDRGSLPRDIIESALDHAYEIADVALRAPPPAEAWKPDREAVARVIDALPWDDSWVGMPTTRLSRKCAALAKADAILAIPTPAKGDK